MTTTKEQIKRTLESKAGKHLGDIVWSEIEGVDGQQYSRTAIADMLDAHGLPRDLIRDDLSAQAALGRARNDCNGLHDGYTILTPKKRDRAFHVFRAEGAGAAAKKVTCAVLSIENGNLVVTPGNTTDATAESVVGAVQARFAYHIDFATHDDITRMVVRTMKRLLGASRLRRTGMLFWVPAQASSHLRSFANVVEGLGGCVLNTMPVYDTAEARDMAGRAVKVTLEGEIYDIVGKLGKLKDSGKPTRESTLERKAEQLAEIHARATSMSDILGTRTEQLRAMLTAAMQEVTDMRNGLKSKPLRARKGRKASRPIHVPGNDPAIPAVLPVAPSNRIDDVDFDF